jgi:hypothetical protein
MWRNHRSVWAAPSHQNSQLLFNVVEPQISRAAPSNCCCCLSNRRSSPAPAVSVVLFLSTPPGEIFPELAPPGLFLLFLRNSPPGAIPLAYPPGWLLFPCEYLSISSGNTTPTCHPATPCLPSVNAKLTIRQRQICHPATPYLPSGNATSTIRQRHTCHPATPKMSSGNAIFAIRQRHIYHPPTPYLPSGNAKFDIRQHHICHPATPYLPSVNAIPAIRQRQTCHLATPYTPSGNSRLGPPTTPTGLRLRHIILQSLQSVPPSLPLPGFAGREWWACCRAELDSKRRNPRDPELQPQKAPTPQTANKGPQNPK